MKINILKKKIIKKYTINPLNSIITEPGISIKIKNYIPVFILR